MPPHNYCATTLLDAPLDPQLFAPSVQQSWGFPEARERVARSTAAVVLSDLMSAALPRAERLALIQDAVAAVLDVVPCEAIHWPRSQQLLDPAAYLAQLEGGRPRLFAGGVNVRLFNVAGEEGGMVMDTMGLAAFGLPDVQCHSRGLAPNEVAPQLYDLALYLFQRGDVIADGNTVDGVPRGTRWWCHHRDALIGPARVVLDLEAGPAG